VVKLFLTHAASGKAVTQMGKR